MKRTSVGSASPAFSASPSNAIYLGFGSSGQVKANWGGATPLTGAYAEGTWADVLLTVSAAGAEALYVDGASVATGTTSGATTSSTISLGGDTGGATFSAIQALGCAILSTLPSTADAAALHNFALQTGAP
jgi:concanavalin A-like lectin/glucanase superfamily protein